MKISRFALAVVLSIAFNICPSLSLEPTLVGIAAIGSTPEVLDRARTNAIVVTTTEDELNQDGDCALREAVQAANTNSVVDGCSAGVGDDTILLSAETYTLSIAGNSEDENASGDLDVSGGLYILGSNTGPTILQAGTDKTNGIDRVLHVLSSSNLTLENVQIRYGLASFGAAPHINGGGIYVAENSTLNVYNSSISENWGANGGGISSASNTTVSLYASRISNNVSYSQGGGLLSLGAAHISNTTFDGNSGIFGGAIASHNGPIDIESSTLSKNAAIEFEGKPGYGGIGGAIYHTGEAKLINSTLSGNSAVHGGGGIRNTGILYLSNDTLTQNSSPTGAGILNLNGVVIVTNSIIAMNEGGDCRGVIASGDYNLDSDYTCSLTQPHDLTGVDPLLSPLADHFGPTWTHAISSASPALDAGNPAQPGSGGAACPDSDQRHVSRPQYAACDIGAYEYEGPLYKVFLPLTGA